MKRLMIIVFGALILGGCVKVGDVHPPQETIYVEQLWSRGQGGETLYRYYIGESTYLVTGHGCIIREK